MIRETISDMPSKYRIVTQCCRCSCFCYQCPFRKTVGVSSDKILVLVGYVIIKFLIFVCRINYSVRFKPFAFVQLKGTALYDDSCRMIRRVICRDSLRFINS